MTIIFRSIQVFVFLILSLFPAFAQAPSSPWVQGLHSRVRLVMGGIQENRLLAGVEIALDPGFKTYWRTPGDSGLPPNFDWSGSDNVAAVDIRWPAPSRLEDAGGVSYVYGGSVTLPILVQPKDPAKPVTLALVVDYGVCKDICIPAHATLSASLSGAGEPHAGIAEALTRVPRPQPLGTKAEAAVLSIARPAPDKPSFVVTVRVPEGTRPVLFAEGPENWYLSTSLPDAENRFTVTVEDGPKGATGAIPVRLTLVAGPHAIETEVSLDAGQQPR